MWVIRMRKGRNIISLIFILLGFVAFMLWIVSIVFDVANRIENLNIPYLVYVYYAAASAFIIYFIIHPFCSVLFAPTFNFKASYIPLLGKQSRKNVEKHYKKMCKFSKRLIRYKSINEENVLLLKEELKKKNLELVEKDTSLQKLLQKIIVSDIQKDIKDIIISSSRDTMYLTALSQNGFVDALVVIVNNFRMLKKIVIRCGFRPSFFRLLKFYINVGVSSMLAEGLEKIDMSSLLGGSLNTIAKPLVGSVMNGAINALTMLRMGFLARNYIFINTKDEKEEAVNGAFLEAIKVLPELVVKSVLTPITKAVSNTIVSPTKKVVKTLFSKKENLVIEEDEEKVKIK